MVNLIIRNLEILNVFVIFISRCCIAKYAVSLSTSFALIQQSAPLRKTRKTGAVAAASFAMCAAGKTSSQRYSDFSPFYFLMLMQFSF